MHIISIGKDTVLSGFETLETKFTYYHSDSETRDFQYYASKPIFIEVDKTKSLEVLRIKQNDDHGMEIQRVRKLNVENVYCVACGKKSVDEMALGLSTGHLKVYNYRSSEFVHTYKPTKLGSNKTCILYADYNASDEYIASVFESGEIHIYGARTKTKINTINVDGNSTMARFHPIKRFHLSIASQKGTVTVYDVQSKRKVFHMLDAHSAPCRDLCMSKGAPDTMISVGYDCMINIFDTRRKSNALQLTYLHPMSTVAMSDCGNFFCVGNLKGEITSFDIRNTKTMLCQNKVHECAVGRVAFLPQLNDKISQLRSSNLSEDIGKPLIYGGSGDIDIIKSPIIVEQPRDSFGEFMQTLGGGMDNHNTVQASINRRQSYDWSLLKCEGSGELSLSNETTGHLQFVNTVRGSKSRSKQLTQSYSTEIISSDQPIDSSRDPILNSGLNGNAHDPTLTDILEEPSPLLDNEDTDASYGKIFKQDEIESVDENDRYETQNNNDAQAATNNEDCCSRGRPGKIIETPFKAHFKGDNELFTPILPEHYLPSEQETNNGCNTLPINDRIFQEIKNLRDDMNTRLSFLENEIKFNAEQNKWQIFSQNSNLHNKQQHSSELIINAMDCLLQNDPFVSDYLRLRTENAQLKARLEELTSKHETSDSS